LAIRSVTGLRQTIDHSDTGALLASCCYVLLSTHIVATVTNQQHCQTAHNTASFRTLNIIITITVQSASYIDSLSDTTLKTKNRGHSVLTCRPYVEQKSLLLTLLSVNYKHM